METKERVFVLSAGQNEKYQKWQKRLKKVDYGAIGGGITFCFTPTGLGNIVKIKSDCGKEIDLTEEW